MLNDPATPADPAGQVAPEPTPTPAGTGSVIVDQGRADRAPPTAPLDGSVAAGAAPAPAPVPAPAAAPAAPFVLRGISFEGATAGDRLLQPVVRRFTGRRMDRAALDALARAVSTAYARSDVALYTVLIPQQDFADGRVRVRVVEGYVESVSARSRHGRRARQVELYARRLLRERPLRKSSFDREVALMRLLPGVSVDVAVLPGDRDGAVKLQVTTDTRHVQLGAAVGDRGTHLLARTTVEADATLNSLLREGDRTSVVVQTSTDFRSLRYVAASHSTPIGSHGWAVQGSLGYLQTRPQGFVVAGHQVEGSARIASLQATYPLLLRNDRTLQLTGAIDEVDSANALLGQHITDEKVRAARLAAAYAQTLAPGRGFTVSATFSQGLPGLGARPAGPGVSDMDFHKLSVNAGAVAAFGRWTVRLRGAAQATGDRLPSSEMLALGGDDFGRAYPAAQVTGDSGAAGSAEVAYALRALVRRAPQGSEVYGFVDGGGVEVRGRPQAGVADRHYSLASAGAGVRVPVSYLVQGALQVEASRRLESNLPEPVGDDWRVVVGYRASY